jgi:hypothetical protein
MPRLWQYQANVDVQRALAQPVAPNGWDVVAPQTPIVKRRPEGEASQAFISSVAITFGWEVIGPATSRRELSDWGSIDAPGAQPAASTATNPLGWVTVAPDKSPKRPTDHGLQVYTLFAPAVTIFGGPLGWEAYFPHRAPFKWSVQPGITEYALRALAQPIVSDVSFTTHSPVSSIKIKTDRGVIYEPFAAPPAATAANPLGWDPTAPDKAKRWPGPAGLTDQPLFVPSPPIPWGWQAEPQNPKKAPTQTEGQDHFYVAPPAPVVQVTVGWEVKAPEKMPKRPIDLGWVFITSFSVPPPPAILPLRITVLSDQFKPGESLTGGFSITSTLTGN